MASWPSGATQVVGVIGDPVAHSLSPLLHNTAFAELGLDWISVAFRVTEGEAAAALTGVRALGLQGLSVTMPHKATVAALVDECSPEAAWLGAVNCVIRQGERLVGENTDGAGFLDALVRGADFEPAGRRCLVVGAGGAGRAVIAALGRAGASEVVVVNRTPGRAKEAAGLAGGVGRVGSAEEAAEVELVVEATPTGMAGSGTAEVDSLVDPSRLKPGQVAVDLVYHPAVTRWMAGAQQAGAQVLGGLGMLVHQAARQITRWTGREAPVEAMWEAARSVL